MTFITDVNKLIFVVLNTKISRKKMNDIIQPASKRRAKKYDTPIRSDYGLQNNRQSIRKSNINSYEKRHDFVACLGIQRVLDNHKLRSKIAKRAKYQPAHEAVKSSSFDAEINSLDSHFVDSKEGLSFKKKLLMVATYSFAIAAFVVAGVFTAQNMMKIDSPDQQVAAATTEPRLEYDAQGVAQGSYDKPSEIEPDDSAFFSYYVESDSPRYIRVPSLQLYSRIKQTSVDRNGNLNATQNIYDAGWYKHSENLGSESGVSILVGYENGQIKDGAFKLVDMLVPGKVIEIEMGNGDVVKYLVETNERFENSKVDLIDLLKNNGNGAELKLLIKNAGDEFSKIVTANLI